jgi:YgiT-type zinc finger domain-containing protein
MKCHICGGQLQEIFTDLPFKLDRHRIVVIRDLPVKQCNSCSEFLISDHVMDEIDKLIEATDEAAELEIRRYAA